MKVTRMLRATGRLLLVLKRRLEDSWIGDLIAGLSLFALGYFLFFAAAVLK
jgi:hypothetical protein